MSAVEGKVLTYDKKWFKPFETSSIKKAIIPSYVWCIEPKDSELIILPTYGRSFDKVRYLFDKDGINVMTYAELNEDGIIYYEQNNLSLFNLDDFAPIEASVGYKKTNSITYNWFIDWSKGRENYKLVIDLNMRTFGYMDSRENYISKRLSLSEAYLKKDVADFFIEDRFKTLEALKLTLNEEAIKKSTHYEQLKRFAMLEIDSQLRENKNLKEQCLFTHASAALKAKAVVELGLDNTAKQEPIAKPDLIMPIAEEVKPVVEEVKPVVEEVKPVEEDKKPLFTFKF
jgi:hypothetical protein